MLAVLPALSALFILAPTVTRSHWILRLLLRETSLATSVAAVLAFALARGWIGRPPPAGDRLARIARALAAAAALVGLLPFLAPMPQFFKGEGAGFSLFEYVAWGARAPAVRIDRNVVLDPSLPQLAVDVYRALGAGPHPFVVAVHGGSWRSGDKGQGGHVSRLLAAGGYTVVDVRYRLAPAHPFPQGIGDVKCLLGRLREKASLHGVDPSRGALLGRSAGGQIALVAAFSAGDPRIPPSCPVEDAPVQGVISLYGPIDLVYGHEHPMRPDIVRGTESLEAYLGGPPSRRPEAYRLGSPLAWLDGLLPRTLLIHGGSDQIVGLQHSRWLESALRARGHRVRLLAVPFGEHGFDIRPGGVGEQLARRAILEFLKDL